MNWVRNDFKPANQVSSTVWVSSALQMHARPKTTAAYNGDILAQVRANSTPGRRRRQHIARTVRLQRPDDARRLHGFEQSRSAVVANLQAPLHVGYRGLAFLRHDF